MDDKDKRTTDKFEDDWQEARAYWKEKHKIFDFAYLQYRSILSLNSLYGQDYLNAFGMNVYVPLTFQAIESISAVLNARKVDIVTKSFKKEDEMKEKYLQTLDNLEWARTKMNNVRSEANKNALIFGLGYYFNPYVEDAKTYHFPEVSEDKETKPSDPSDGEEQGDAPVLPELKKDIVWKPKKIIRYQGMKPKSLDPYYVFPDPNATSNEDWRYCYTYTITTVDAFRDYVVSNGLMTKEQAEKKIVEGESIEKFDAIRDTMDALFKRDVGAFTRGDHEVGATVTGTALPMRRNQIAVIERYEEDYYEIRIAGKSEKLYSDYNIYPHKKIPLVPVWDYKIPGEFAGMGEPEIIRWQQIETNRIHNSVLDALLMATVQRYAIRADLLEDESDISFHNPFKPIRLKNLPGLQVSQAIMPMPQPDIKQSPFQLMDLVKQTIQQTTGASDFVVSGNASATDTATESNNLVAATTNRMREKTRQMDETSLPYLVEQWHAIYPMFYTEDMDLRLVGEPGFVKYLSLDRTETNEDKEEIEKAAKKLNSSGNTLVDVYLNAGYKQVIFLSDTTGGFTVEIELTDTDLNANKEFDKYMKTLGAMTTINEQAKAQGETKQFDIWKFGEKMIGLFPMIKSPEDYIKQAPAQAPALPGMSPQEPTELSPAQESVQQTEMMV
jgi:hypothetical protein